MDLWMLSRVSNAAKICDEGFAQYDFTAATTACYNLWLYDLCDVYLECIKPVFQNGTNDEKSSAQRVLFKTLDVGLRLLSPFMPFITEELYQRLPRKNQTHPSICVSSYPTALECPWRNEEIEKDVDFAQKIVRTIRSSRATYLLPNKTKTEAFIVCSDESLKEKISQYLMMIGTLAYSHLQIGEIPSGCAILTVSDKVQVHLLLKGLIDPQKELERLKKKEEQLKEAVQRLEQSMSATDYSTKVPEEVQKMNDEKLFNNKGELSQLCEAMETLLKM